MRRYVALAALALMAVGTAAFLVMALHHPECVPHYAAQPRCDP